MALSPPAEEDCPPPDCDADGLTVYSGWFPDGGGGFVWVEKGLITTETCTPPPPGPPPPPP